MPFLLVELGAVAAQGLGLRGGEVRGARGALARALGVVEAPPVEGDGALDVLVLWHFGQGVGVVWVGLGWTEDVRVLMSSGIEELKSWRLINKPNSEFIGFHSETAER